MLPQSNASIRTHSRPITTDRNQSHLPKSHWMRTMPTKETRNMPAKPETYPALYDIFTLLNAIATRHQTRKYLARVLQTGHCSQTAKSSRGMFIETMIRLRKERNGFKTNEQIVGSFYDPRISPTREYVLQAQQVRVNHVLATCLIRPDLSSKRGLSCYFTCAGYLLHSPGFVWLNGNFKKRYGSRSSFRHILQKSKYKKPTTQVGFLSSLAQNVTSCGSDRFGAADRNWSVSLGFSFAAKRFVRLCGPCCHYRNSYWDKIRHRKFSRWRIENSYELLNSLQPLHLHNCLHGLKFRISGQDHSILLHASGD